MFFRRTFGLVWALLSLAVLGIVAWFAYNAGLATNVQSNGQPGPYYYHEGFFGFGFFWLILIVLFLAFAFRRRRWHGYGGGPWRGYGKHGGSGEPGMGPDVPPFIDEKLRSWHDRAHGVTPPAPPAETTGSEPTGGSIGQA